MRTGYILVEASVVYVILALALVALLPLFVLCFQASRSTTHIALCTQLAGGMLEEVRIRRWDERTPASLSAVEEGSPALGADPGEAAADKRAFDDVDDFDKWAEKPPLDPGMGKLAGLDAYSRNVSVSYVGPMDLDAAAATPTGYKRVTACAQWNTNTPVCLRTVLANR